MSVIISNITPADVPDTDLHTYELKFSRRQPMLTFTHVRAAGLAAMLRAAADAVDAHAERDMLKQVLNPPEPPLVPASNLHD